MGCQCFKAAGEEEEQVDSKQAATSSQVVGEYGVRDQVAVNGPDRDAVSQDREHRMSNSLEEAVQFRRYPLDELLTATERFGEQNIVSEGGRQAVNVVYRGKVRAARGSAPQSMAIKRFSKREWEDSRAFVTEAQKVSRVDHPNVTTLLGFCCDGEDRLLVSEYMPNSTLAQHLFHWEQSPMPWGMRLNVAVQVAVALHHLQSVVGIQAYHDLNPYRVLFSKDLQPKLSSFGLLKPMRDGKFSSNLPSAPPELYMTGIVTPATVVYMFGALLLSLFSGKSMRPLQFVELVASKHDMVTLLDSQLVGKPGVEQAMELVPLMVECLQHSPERRPPIGRISEFLCILQSGGGIPESVSEARGEAGASLEETTMNPFKRAALVEDYERMHRILSSDDFNPSLEPSFEMWNADMAGALSFRQRGSHAFQRGQWDTAIEELTKYVNCDAPMVPILWARRSFAHARVGLWANALEDAIQARTMKPGWLEAQCLEALCLVRLGREAEGEAIFASLP